jgi:MFS family permease
LTSRINTLWNHKDFIKVWSAHTVSQFGSQITVLALPLTAVTVLQATPEDMGALAAMSTIPYLLVGLPAGAWVDRWPKRPILLLADAIRFLLLLSIPLLAVLGHLHIFILYAVALLSGVATLFFDIAAQSYLPLLVGRGQLMNGNAKLEASRAVATVVGPSLAGILAQLFSAPFVIFGDAMTFLVSGIFLAGVRQPEPMIIKVRSSLLPEIAEGVRVLWQNSILWALFRTAVLWNFFTTVIQAILLLYATRQLHLSSSQVGLAFSMLGLGMLPGTALAKPIQRFGIGPALLISGFLAASSGLIAFLAGIVEDQAAMLLLMLSQFIFGFGPMIFGINMTSLRQAVTPDHLQGRVIATIASLCGGARALGALTGGFLGGGLGLLATVGIGAVGMIFSVALLLLSPLPSLHQLDHD